MSKELRPSYRGVAPGTRLNGIYEIDQMIGAGGMVRDVDPRAAQMSFRQITGYTLAVDELKPVSSDGDPRSELDLDRTTFLAAVDRSTKAPEVRIPGIDGLRGALSYAFARAIEGNADIDHDGKVTLKELFTNVRQVVYQLSDQRQNVVTMVAPRRARLRSMICWLARRICALHCCSRSNAASGCPISSSASTRIRLARSPAS